MFIKISSLSEGVNNFSFNEPIEKIDLAEPFCGNFFANVELSKTRNQILLNAEINLKAVFACDRCNSDFSKEIISNYRMVYMFGKEPIETEAVNITYLPINADKIILTDDFRDYSILSIPMKKLCMENCKGLCIKCGKNLNEQQCVCSENEIDERWSPLLELKNKLNSN